MSQAYPPKPAPFPVAGTEVPRRRSGCGCTGCAIGCLGMLVLCAIACGITGYVIHRQMPTIIRDTVDNVLASADVDPQDRRDVMTQVDRVADGYRDGSITFEKLAEMAQKLQDSPLVPVLILKGVERQYLDRSGLDDDEKHEARVAMGRVARGMFEGKIPEPDQQKLLTYVTEGTPTNRNAKKALSDKELREFITACKDVADEHEIADEEFTVDPAKELKRIIDEVLGVKDDVAPPIEPAEPAEAPPVKPSIELPDDANPKTESESTPSTETESTTEGESTSVTE